MTMEYKLINVMGDLQDNSIDLRKLGFADIEHMKCFDEAIVLTGNSSTQKGKTQIIALK